METRSSFHPGAQPKLTKQEKRKRDLERRREKERQLRRSQPRPHFIPNPLWRILPCEFQIAFMIDTLRGNTYFEKLESLEEYGSILLKKSSLLPDFKVNSDFTDKIQTLKMEAKAKMAENQTFRWKFKRFLSRWRISRFKQINENDYITMAPIEKQIVLYDFSTRSKYLFESTSILQDIHKKLLHHYGPIPTPLFPRNPYTNEHFTMAQLLSIQQQCKRVGNASWILEAFCKSKLSIPCFLQVQRKSLRLHAMKSILYDYTDYEGNALFINFIESQHEEHNAQFNKALYRWCLLKIPEDPKIQKWRSFCKEYYEEDILAEDETQREDCFLRIARKTGELCAPPHDLLAKRNLLVHRK